MRYNPTEADAMQRAAVRVMIRPGRVQMPAGYGVVAWVRRLGGRWFRFALIVLPCWPDAPAGTLTVYTQPSPVGDWYPIHTFTVEVPS